MLLHFDVEMNYAWQKYGDNTSDTFRATTLESNILIWLIQKLDNHGLEQIFMHTVYLILMLSLAIR